MQQRFLRIFKDLVPKPQQFRFLVAVSGGVDSMVLVALMQQSGLSFGIAHCNFNLRGRESDRDQDLVKTISEKYGVPFFVKSFETKQYAQDYGLSTQMAARDLRYGWFNDLLEKEGFDFLAVAHHANDNFETALFNLVKGTGIAGVRGIKTLNANIIRPLLSFSKEEILQFATENKTIWREDKSNESSDYHRNFLRNEVIPKLQKVNPSLLTTFWNTSQRLSGIERILDSQLAFFEERFSEDGVFTLRFEEFNQSVNQDLFIELLQRKGFDRNVVKRFLLDSYSLPGTFIQNDNFKLWKERTAWVLEEQKGIFASSILLQKAVFKTTIDNLTLETNLIQKVTLKELKSRKNTIYLDTNKWHFPLEIRTWKEGDRIQPFGMKGTKLVSDILIDQKVSARKKVEQKVLVSDGVILAVLGLKTSERLRFNGDISDAFKIYFRFN